jgi:hypothetical protein
LPLAATATEKKERKGNIMAKHKLIQVLAGSVLSALCTAVRARSGSTEDITKADGEFVEIENKRFLRVGDALCMAREVATQRGKGVGGTWLGCQVIRGSVNLAGIELSAGDGFTLDSAGAVNVDVSEVSELDAVSELLSEQGLPNVQFDAARLLPQPAPKPERKPRAAAGRMGARVVAQGTPSRFASNPTDLSDSPALAALDAMTDAGADEPQA